LLSQGLEYSEKDDKKEREFISWLPYELDKEKKKQILHMTNVILEQKVLIIYQ